MSYVTFVNKAYLPSTKQKIYGANFEWSGQSGTPKETNIMNTYNPYNLKQDKKQTWLVAVVKNSCHFFSNEDKLIEFHEKIEVKKTTKKMIILF